MVRVTPASTTPERLSLDFEGGGVEEMINYVPTKKQNVVLRCMLSLRVFLLVLLTVVVVFTSFSIWITSYEMNEKATVELEFENIKNMKDKLAQFLYMQLVRPKYVADSIARDYYDGYIDMNDGVLKYLFFKLKLFGVTMTNFCFGEGGHNIVYGFTSTGPSVSFFLKKQTENRMIMWDTNTETGVINFNKVTSNNTYSVFTAAYYKESIALLDKYPEKYTEGVFGTPYKPLNGPIATFWSTPVYDKAYYPLKKKRIGLAKINLSLEAISNFLAEFKVMERGFIILSEYDTNLVIGYSLTKEGLGSQRLPIFNITQRGAGQMMQAIVAEERKNNTLKIVTSNNGETFLIDSSAFEYYNIKWRMTIFVSESEIKEGVIISSYVIMGVTVFVTIIGILIGFLIGYLVTNPLFNLQKDFKKIEVLDLQSIEARNSVFSETKSIYSSLAETVRWLAEIKTFIPDSVVNQLENTNNQNKEESIRNIIPASTSKNTIAESSAVDSGSLNSSQRSKMSKASLYQNDSKSTLASNIFKLGLIKSECAVVCLTIPNLDADHFDFESGMLSNVLSKTLTSISTICKTSRADLQIKGHNEFIIFFSQSEKNPAYAAIDTSLKIQNVFTSINELIAKEGKEKMQCCMGISSGKLIQGNIGNQRLRYFALIGPVLERAKQLNQFSQVHQISIIADSNSFTSTKTHFVFRTIDRILNGHRDNIEYIYEVVKRNQVNDDEWFYELEQKTAHQKYEDYSAKFSRLCSTRLSEDDFATIVGYIQDYSVQNPKDKASAKILELLTHFKGEVPDLTKYYSTVERKYHSILY